MSLSMRDEFAQRWSNEYNYAFKKRNTVLWYSIIFYFYGIFDAIVDAHMHDYIHKVRIEPGVENQSGSISLTGKLLADF